MFIGTFVCTAPWSVSRPIPRRTRQSQGLLCVSRAVGIGQWCSILGLLGPNELGYLPRLARVSSVSGGSITAGVLALHWKSLNFDDKGVARDFQPEITAPIRNLASRTIDATAILEGLLLPGTVSDKVRAAYQEYSFGHDTPGNPRFTPFRLQRNQRSITCIVALQ